MKPIKFIFSSLFSNKTVIDETKNQPWWLAILLVIISCIVSVIPMFSSVMSINGSDALTATENYNIDYSLKQFSLDYLGKDDVNFVIEDGKLKVENFTQAEVKHGEDITLLVHYVDYNASDEQIYGSFNDKINYELNKIKASHPTTETNKSKMYSTLILGKEGIYLYLYGKDAVCTYVANTDGSISISEQTEAGSSIYGTYENITGDLANISGYLYGSTEDEKVNNAYNNWKELFNTAYQGPRNQLALTYSLSFLGIDLMMILTMTIMIFLISKSKTSVRKFKFFETLKMVFFSALSPALIGLLLGLLMPSFQSMAFIMCYVLRMTWLGMKATSPQEATTATRK